ncbi:hypothetical protein [Saccharothrix variisporea]|uniref:O-antigen/teichoic acid export membrane protein n=1 Tax=Saccharothrix variisporea TaxID=543527 RepID=A0A495X0P0_9PSEU|nr:hypothetical protein [Saccharothrix variisporea]RKT67691.1 hypothetical protein DFJ66_0867 [Saccharothrix variisporea]
MIQAPARVRSWAPAAVSATASVLVTVAGLLIARYDGFGVFGEFVAVQAIGVVLGIPMLWGVHVGASRAIAERSPVGAVVGTAVGFVVLASVLTAAAYFGVLAVVGADAVLWHAAGLGASAALLTLAESLLRIRGRHLRASGLRLGYGAAYLVAVVFVVGHGSAAGYSVLVAGGNTLCALLMLVGMRFGRPDVVLARTFLREGWAFSTGQSLLALLFGFDVILLVQAAGPAAVGVYALYVGSCRRVIGVLFTDSLASVLISVLARRDAATGRRAVLRYAPRLLVLSVVGASALVVVGLVAADAVEHFVVGWMFLAAVGCTAHALVVVLFCVFTVRPELGLGRVRAVLAVAFAPGLAAQAAGAVFGGAPGMIAAFTAANAVLAWWFLAVLSTARGIR